MHSEPPPHFSLTYSANPFSDLPNIFFGEASLPVSFSMLYPIPKPSISCVIRVIALVQVFRSATRRVVASMAGKLSLFERTTQLRLQCRSMREHCSLRARARNSSVSPVIPTKGPLSALSILDQDCRCDLVVSCLSVLVLLSHAGTVSRFISDNPEMFFSFFCLVCPASSLTF